MKRVFLILLLFATAAFAAVGDREFAGDLLPETTDTYSLGSSLLKWEDIFANGDISAGTFTGDGSALTGIAAGTGGVINTGSTTIGADSDSDGSGILVLQTRGTTRLTVANDGSIAIAGTVTSGVWNGTAIDISSYTNLTAGTNITLSGDTLNVDDAFLVNNASDTTTGVLTTAGVTITTGNALTLGTTQWDNGSDKIEGNILADDSVDDDALDFTSITLADFTVNIASTDLTDTADILYEAELDSFSELQAQIADKTLLNEEDAATIDSAWTFATGITGAVTGDVTGDVTGNADTATLLETTRAFSVSGDVATAAGVNFNGGAPADLAVSFATGVIVNEDVNTSAAISADKLTDGSTNAIPTLTQETNWDTHLSSNGSDHSFIDQDVTSGANPVLVNTNMTGNISVWTNDSGYLDTESSQDVTGGMVSGNTETLIAVTYDDPGGKLDFVVDEAGIDHDSLTNFTAAEHFIQSAITQVGIITIGTWRGTDVDIGDYTNLAGGTNLTLTNDTLHLDNPVLTDVTGDVIGDLTGNADTATNVVDNDFGDVLVSGGSWVVQTVAGADVPLGTGTTGNYVATIADAGNTTITVVNSGSETAAVTLDVINVADANMGDVVISGGVWGLDTDSVADNEIDYTSVTLADFTDDVGYLRADGSVDLTADWVVSANSITLAAGTLTANTLTDGVATLTGGALTGLTNLAIDNININGNTIHATGNLTITASGGTVSFGNEHLTTTGNISGANVTVSGILTSDDLTGIYTALSVSPTEKVKSADLGEGNTDWTYGGDWEDSAEQDDAANHTQTGWTGQDDLLADMVTVVVATEIYRVTAEFDNLSFTGDGIALVSLGGVTKSNATQGSNSWDITASNANALNIRVENGGAPCNTDVILSAVSVKKITPASVADIHIGPAVSTVYGDIYIAEDGGDIFLVGDTRIGSEVAPTVKLDVTGAALISSTLGVTGLTTATGGLVAGGATNNASISATGAQTYNGSAKITGLKINTVAKTAAYTATATDDVITCGAGNETFTITLPAVAGSTGKVFHIKNVGTGIITVDGNAAENIDGAATAVITTQYECITIVCDGTEWWIL